MNPPLATRLRLTDGVRREWFVTKVDFLAQDVPGGYRNGMRRGLRADLSTAVAFSIVTVAVVVVIPLVATRAWRYRPAWLLRRRSSVGR